MPIPQMAWSWYLSPFGLTPSPAYINPQISLPKRTTLSSSSTQTWELKKQSTAENKPSHLFFPNWGECPSSSYLSATILSSHFTQVPYLYPVCPSIILTLCCSLFSKFWFIPPSPFCCSYLRPSLISYI